MRFSSDNGAGAAPEILEAMTRANEGATMGYGADDWTRRAEAMLAERFERDCAVFLVATGTAANALALAVSTPPWGSVFCHRISHANEDECGAPEFYSGGAKLIPLEGADARISLESFDEAARAQGARGVHQTAPSTLTLTQATEAGAVYAPDHVAALAERAHAKGMTVHMDGARFSNALVRSGRSPAEMSWKLGVDIMSLGATKNGAVGAEAILVFDKTLAETLAHRRKRGGHLFSKMRFVSAQIVGWLEDDLWLRLARHANAMADRLAAGLAAIPGMTILHPVEANMVFLDMPVAAHLALREAGATYYQQPEWQPDPPEPGTERFSARLVCSFMTSEADVDGFLRVAAGAS